MTDDYKDSPTFFLFGLPSFWGGVASAIDMGGTLAEINMSQNGTQADYLAILSDWMAVGNDLRKVMADHPLEEFATA